MSTNKKGTNPAKERADEAFKIWSDDSSEEYKAIEEEARIYFEGEHAIQPVSEKEADKLERDLTPAQRFFLDAYIASLGSVARAAKVAKITARTGFRWLQQEGFQRALNARMLQWELLLHWRMMHLAMAGNTTLMIFLAKFLNPFYDDQFRAAVAKDEISKSMFDRYPIPRPEFLPPEIPERFGQSTTGSDSTKPTGDPEV